ncbi:MAG: glycosyltransferase family 2 protein [Candidatus Omnitrophica bacterium]|nr:glycosyltransferase family 2 protein [Candidatus Omnitrophota bacterium]
MNYTPFISIIVCTYNRCQSLKDTLESFTKLNFSPDINYEILIIDNNSTDQTKNIAQSYVPFLGNKLRYLFEAQQGKCYALNLSINEAKGDVLAFTDDDVIVDPNYLLEINKIFSKPNNEIEFIGGKILPLWEGDKPSWISGSLMGALAMLDYGKDEFIIDSNYKLDFIRKHIFFGANFVFRKKLFKKFGQFNTKKIVAEDTEMCMRLYKNGVKSLYAPSVIVYHKVPVSRTTPEYFFKWFSQQGQYQEIIDFSKSKFYQPFGIPYWFLMQTLFFYFKSLIKKDQYKKVLYRCWALFNFAQINKVIRKI